MYMDSLTLENLRTFAGPARKPLILVHPERDFRPARAPLSSQDDRLPRPRLPNVTLLLGDNGSGKTTILRAIAASAFGPAAKDLLRDSTIIRHGESLGTITATIRLHDQDRAAQKAIETLVV